MASKLYLIILSFSLFFTSNSPAPVVAQECPYPCYPPPTGGSGGGGGNTPATTTYPPPSQTGYYPPPSGIFPYNPPNPNYGGGPLAPDPIVPWFPYYYKKPPHNPDRSSFTGGRVGSTVAIFLIINFSLLLLCSLS